MSAAPQLNYSIQSFPVTRPHSSSSAQKTKSAPTALSPISSNRPIPLSEAQVSQKFANKYNFVHQKQTAAKLKPLLLLQKVAFGIGSCLMVSSALVYISSVPIPQMWSQEYEQLKSLQRQERELTAANETIKNDLVKQAQHQLLHLQPNDVIFVEKTEIAPQSIIDTQKNNDSIFESIPLGY